MDRTDEDPDTLRGFDESAARAVAFAGREARTFGHDRVGTEHLLLGLLTGDGEMSAVLNDAGVTLAAARHKVSEAVGEPSTAGTGRAGPLPRTARATRALGRAARFAHTEGSDVVASGHLLWGVLDVEGTAGQVLRGLGVEVDALLRTLLETLHDRPPAALRPTTPTATTRDHTARDRAVAARCPSCSVDIEGNLAARVVAAAAEAGTSHGAMVFSCANCGQVLGIAPT